jgi:hypothetical protein
MNEQEQVKKGFGALEGAISWWEKGVYDFLRLGYPKLALACAQGIPLVPYYVNVKTTFDNPDRNLNPEVGSDNKIVADTIIDQMVFLITTDRVGQNVLDYQNRYYQNLVNGIEAKLNVVGMPRPAVAPRFTPLPSLANTVAQSFTFPHGLWVLTYQQQLQVDFLARIQLPDFPTTVTLTFRCFTPQTDKYDGSQLTDSAALQLLRDKCGIAIPDCYTTACKA